MTAVVNIPHSNFSENLILQALQSSPEPTAIYTGEEITIRFANAGMLALWGKDPSVIGKPLLEAIPELVGQPFFEILQQVWHSGKTYSVSDAPAELIKNGAPVTDYFDYEYRALLDFEGNTWCILNTAREVNSRMESLQRIQQKEKKEHALNEELTATLRELTSTNHDLNLSLEQLAQSRAHVRTIIEQAPVGIAMLEGPDLIIEIANATMLKIWGREEAEVLGKPHSIARPELIGQQVGQWLEDVFTTGTRKINNELILKLHDKEGLREAIVNSIYQPIFSPQGEVIGVLIILEEITQQVLEKRKSEKDQHMLAMAIEAGELATFYYEPHSNSFSGNALLKTWFGLPPEEQIDLSIAIGAVYHEDRERVANAIMKVLDTRSDGDYVIEYRIQPKPDMAIRLLQANGKVFYDQAGKVLSLNGTLRDITEQKKDEQRKDDFMAMVSHELKTPLTSLNAYLQLMQRSALADENAKQQDLLAKSARQVRHMNAMINGFLNISRLESGKMFLDKSAFDLLDLLAELEDELQSVIYSHKIVFEKLSALPVIADREKIAQVIHNLVGNAIKYSPLGTRITVGYVTLVTGEAEVYVSDEGIGIAEEDRKQIFERFYRVKSSRTGSIAGFGIGLFLCREIVELHQGKIKVVGNGETGSTFSFTLPL